MRILYLDDSGKIHAHDASKVVVFAGFSIDESAWHAVLRQITGAKANFFASRGNPHSWEIKSTDFLTKNNWNRAYKRRFCFELPNILKKNGCHVYVASMEKANAVGSLDESKFVPLAFQRLVAKFHHEITSKNTTGSVVCDWSTHKLDQHITQCVSSMVVAKGLWELHGGVTYGSSHALCHLQTADLIAGAFRRVLEGDNRLKDLAEAFRNLRYEHPQKDVLGFPVDSIVKIF